MPPPTPERMRDVEQLNDRIAALEGRRVTVAGMLDEHLDGRAFVLESGGPVDDELTVAYPEHVQGLQPQQLQRVRHLLVAERITRQRD